MNHEWHFVPGGSEDRWCEWCCLCGALKVVCSGDSAEYYDSRRTMKDSHGELLGVKEEPPCISVLPYHVDHPRKFF